jgi:hypothetical protein
MTLYTQTPKSVTWPEPLETTWQLLGGEPARELAPKLPHLAMADILFMCTVMLLPRAERPWGIVTWMAEVFCLSRPALYALTERVRNRLLGNPEATPCLPPPLPEKVIEVTENRLVRTVLTGSLPGKTAIRPLRHVLEEAFDQTRSIGWISELLTEAGQKAGTILNQVDLSALGTVIVLRDELFFHGQPLLLVVDPISSTILLAVVCDDRQSETWGAALLMTEERGVTIGGIVEDMAKMYTKSLKEAELEAVDIQKDIWHVERDGGKLLRKLERAAFKATAQVVELEKALLQQWDETCFIEKYIPAVAQEEYLYEQHAVFEACLSHLADGLELVDVRSGEIRDRAINEWLLNETLQLMDTIDHKDVQKWVRTLRRHQKQLLTALDWLETALQPYRQQLADLMSPEDQEVFMRLVARHWRLQKALINGHTSFRFQAQEAEADLQSLLAHDDQWQQMAESLQTILDGACRASSLIENINGLLRAFLHAHKAYSSAKTLQLYLNLFVLWHNMRVYERGKRQGKSPYQWAGIDVGTDDWLTLLGYPAG